MKSKLYKLCHTRSIQVTQQETKDFFRACNLYNIHPSGGDYVDGKVTYTLPKSVTDAEASLIAEVKGELGTYKYFRESKRYTPFMALAELNLL